MSDSTLPVTVFGSEMLPKKSFGGANRYVHSMWCKRPLTEERWRTAAAAHVRRQVQVIVDEVGPVEVRPEPDLPSHVTNAADLRRWNEWVGGEIVVIATQYGLDRNRICMPIVPSGHGERWTLSPGVVRALTRPVVPATAPPSVLIDRMRQALADTRWQFRTVEGLARSLDVTQDEVRYALRELGEEVRMPLAADASGRELYTLRKRRPTLRERYMRLRERLATW